jgi:phosphate transport system permease protein
MIDNDLMQRTPHLIRRHRNGQIGRVIFLISTVIGLIALIVLILSILNQSMGLVIVRYTVEPTTLSEKPLDELEAQELSTILVERLKPSRLRTIERDTPLASLNRTQLYNLVMEEIVVPKVQKSFHLDESLLQRAKIEQIATEEYPGAHITFRSWINWNFIVSDLSKSPEIAGIRTALMGSLWIIIITIVVAFPIGVGAAIYLEEYASNSRINRLIQTNIDNLAGVPSIIYGILGLAIFVRSLGQLTQGRTVLSAGLTMALLILPILIINAQEAIRAVPNSLRQASYGLGATQWQTIWHHVLPYALPGILTGTILSISRAFGETAPLILVGASSFINKDPSSLFSRFTVLPIQIYNWTSRPQDTFRNIAAAAIIILILTLLTLNAVAILLRNRFSKRV